MFFLHAAIDIETHSYTHKRASVKLNSILFVKRRDFSLNDASSTSTHNTNMHSAYWNFCYGCCRCRCRRRKSRRNLLFAQPNGTYSPHIIKWARKFSMLLVCTGIYVCVCVWVSASLCIHHLLFSFFAPFSLPTDSRFCNSRLFS